MVSPVAVRDGEHKPDSLDLPEPLEPVGGVGLPARPQRLLDLRRQVAVEGQLPHHDRQVAVRDDFRFLLRGGEGEGV